MICGSDHFVLKLSRLYNSFPSRIDHMHLASVGRDAMVDLKSTLFVLYFILEYNFVETQRKFIIEIINLRGVSTKLYFNLIFTMQSYKEHIYIPG